jgi:hypothetical protein
MKESFKKLVDAGRQTVKKIEDVKDRVKMASYVSKNAMNVPEKSMGISGRHQELLKTLFSNNPRKRVEEVLEEKIDLQEKSENLTHRLISERLNTLGANEFILLTYTIDGIDYKETITKDVDGNVEVEYKGVDRLLNQEKSKGFVRYSNTENFFKNPKSVYLLSKGLKDPHNINLNMAVLPRLNDKKSKQSNNTVFSSEETL